MSSESPLISIIMTSYNTSEFIAAAIESIIRQTYKNWELLIADDCSTDNTRQIISKYANRDQIIIVSHNSENLHYLKTRNRLFKEAEGEFVTLLDADDLMLNTRLEKQLGFMFENPELAVCGCFVSYIDQKGNPIKVEKPFPPTDHESIKKIFPISNPFTGSSLFFKKSVLVEFGGYREFFSGLCSEDYDLGSRIAEKYPCANYPEPLYVYRQFPTSTTRIRDLENPKKYFSHQLAQLFISQRKNGGKDFLELGRHAEIEAYLERLSLKYKTDKSLFHIELVTSHLYAGLLKDAVKEAFKAVRANPLKTYNYRTLKYTLVKWLF
jgi:teichuronic acid biosynthesis glycosyltransferase TuaG